MGPGVADHFLAASALIGTRRLIAATAHSASGAQAGTLRKQIHDTYSFTLVLLTEYRQHCFDYTLLA